jgi:peptidoglycan/xylan/chitin deacetylase (PgdA/CDA1 family)
MRLRVGILGASAPSWEPLLRQIGVPCGDARGSLSVGEWSAVAAADDATDAMILSLRQYLASGGGVLCSARVQARIAGGPAAAERSIRYLLQDPPGGIFPSIGLVDLFLPCAVSREANAVRANDGRMTVFAGPFGGGMIVALPVDVPSALKDARSISKSFWAERSKLPHERVSLVSRGGIRRLVTRSLEYLHHQRGLPFLHLWHYPGEAQSLFAFRVDTDFATRREVEPLYALLAAHGLGATWFVHVEGQEELLPFYGRIDGHEIGIHCFTHRAFEREEEIDADIARAASALSAAGIPFRGYAGPYGRWSAALARSVARRGFEYSSEFSYDYDNLPSFAAPDGGGERSVLEVPIHPVSIGSLRRQGCSPAEMLRYFSAEAERRLAVGDPLFWYHHPKNLHLDVLEGLFSQVREWGVAPILLGEYARWWKRRLEVRLAADASGSLLALSGPAPGGDVRCRVTRGDGKACFVDPAATVDLQRATWTPVPSALPLPDDIRRIRAFNPWIPLNHLEDAVHRKFFS